MQAAEEGIGLAQIFRRFFLQGVLWWRIEPIGKLLWFVESKDRARARFGVDAVGKAGFGAGGLVSERQRVVPARQAIRQAFGVFVGLGFDAGEGHTLLLGFDDAGGLAVDVKQVIGKTVAGFEREFADRHAACGADVDFRCVAHMPASGCKQLVYGSPGLLFRRHCTHCFYILLIVVNSG